MESAVLRLVIDTQTWMDLLHFEEPACSGLAGAVNARDVEVVRNDAAESEWTRVLGYPRFGLDAAARQDMLRRFRRLSSAVADGVSPDGPRLPRCRDPDDQVFLELALAARADVLVSRDKALLELDRRCRRLGFAVLRANDPELLQRLHDRSTHRLDQGGS